MSLDSVLHRAAALGRDLGQQPLQQMFEWLLADRHHDIAQLVESLLTTGAELAPEASRTAAYVDLADVVGDDHTGLLHRLRDSEAEYARALALVLFAVGYAAGQRHATAGLFRRDDGWYYRLALSGALPEADSDPIGPFTTEAEALADRQARQMWTE